MKSSGINKNDRASSDIGNILYYFRYILPHWRLGIVSICLTIFSTILSGVIPLSSKLIIDFLVIGKPEIPDGASPVFAFIYSLMADSLEYFFIGMFFLGLLILISRGLQAVADIKLEQEIIFDVHTLHFNHLLRFPIAYVKKKQVGHLMSRISHDVDQLQGFFTQSVTRLTTNFLYLAVGFVILSRLSLKITIILFILLPCLSLVIFLFSSRIREASDAELETEAEVAVKLQESISGIEVVKSNVTEKKEVERLSNILRKLFNTQLLNHFFSSISNSLLTGGKVVITMIIVWIAIWDSKNGGISAGDVAAFATYAFFLAGLAGRLCYNLIMLQPMIASIQRVRELFQAAPETNFGKKAPVLLKPRLSGEILFDKVSFHYNSENPVLTDINLLIRQGEVIALSGASGEGKTTLVNLLLKFEQPAGGRILFDSYDIADIDPQWLRKNVGIVSQDVFLFNDTALNNIRYGAPTADMDEVVEAAVSASIHDDIVRMPQGYRTIVGERGYMLSNGQKQRVSIARALLRKPAILILDEPSAALDRHTENALKKSLLKEKGRRTVLVVTHRRNMLEIADRAILLQNGRISESRI